MQAVLSSLTRSSKREAIAARFAGRTPTCAHPRHRPSRCASEMRKLAALMVSMTLLTTVLFLHAIATADDRAAPRTGPVAIRDSARQLPGAPGG